MYGSYPFLQNAPNFQNQFQQQKMELVRVNGVDGARAYQMPPNSTAALFDGGSDVMYIKQTDGAGFATVRTFTFSEQNIQPQQSCGYVTRSEYNDIIRQIDEIRRIADGKQSVST